MTKVEPGLFGLKKTNRDFTQKETWGKNQFNSSFPASLCCYLSHKQMDANYLSMKNDAFGVRSVGVDKVLGISPSNLDIYFAFEAQHSPFQKYVIGTLPRTDLVIQKESTGTCLSALEVKLTALPDNTTCELDEQNYGSELVIRPDTIVYLACSIANSMGRLLGKVLDKFPIAVDDWSDASDVIQHVDVIANCIEYLAKKVTKTQTPFLLQPIWKTIGKSPKLSNNCLDVFVWSNAGFCWFLSKISNQDTSAKKITRQTRTAIWLYKMLLDIKDKSKFDHERIIDELSYNTKNDKAFASAGNVTNPYMKCNNLTKPRIQKGEIKNMILGGGQNLLSPERRFDAIIFNSPELFD